MKIFQKQIKTIGTKELDKLAYELLKAKHEGLKVTAITAIPDCTTISYAEVE